MVGCVATEINTEPHSLALKNHAVCLDIKEIRQGILGKLNTCHLLSVLFWRCVLTFLERCVSMGNGIQAEMGPFQLCEGGMGAGSNGWWRQPWLGGIVLP